MTWCQHCGASLKKYQAKYCSNKCQADRQYDRYIQNWKKGLMSGDRGVNTHNISKHLRRYLVEKFGERCSSCGWAVKHPQQGRVPLEIDHMDGNANNNAEKNLRLICPNCHALTGNYRNLNKGHGRGWRRERYVRAA